MYLPKQVIDEILQKSIDEVCNRLEWPIGHVYFPARDNPERLDSSKLWFCDNPDRYKVFRDITETTSFDIGAGLPGRVLINGLIYLFTLICLAF